MFQNYAPTTFNRYISDSLVANKRVRYTIWDTAGTREANSTRTLACREADVFLVCYKIAEPASLFSAINFWVPEVRAQAPSTPVILVGCQSDLRTDRGVVAALAKVGKSPVSSQQALAMSQQIQAVMYVETSAKTSVRGVSSAMEVAALTSLGQISAANTGAATTTATTKGRSTPSGLTTPRQNSSPVPPPPTTGTAPPIHQRQSSLVPSTPSPMISKKQPRNRSLSVTRHRHDVYRTSLRPVDFSPSSQGVGANDSLLSLEPADTIWDQFNATKENFSPACSPRQGGVAGGDGGDSPASSRQSQSSPRSPILAARSSKMGSLSSMSMRSKSSTLSSTKSDASMNSVNNNINNNNTSVHSNSSSSSNKQQTISITTTKTPRQARKTPDKSKTTNEKMITIKCQRLTADRTYEEVEIEVPAPVYETMQNYSETGSPGGGRREKRGGLGTKIKCLFSKTAA